MRNILIRSARFALQHPFDDDAEIGPDRLRGYQSQENNLMQAAYYQTGDMKYMDVIQSPNFRMPRTAGNGKNSGGKVTKDGFHCGCARILQHLRNPWIDRVYITGDGLVSDRLADPYMVPSRFMYPSNESPGALKAKATTRSWASSRPLRRITM